MPWADGLLLTIYTDYMYLYRMEEDDLHVEARFMYTSGQWEAQVWTNQSDFPNLIMYYDHFNDVMMYCEKKAERYGVGLLLEHY